jgi:hypothetical protein
MVGPQSKLVSRERGLEVRQNLEAALRHLRLLDNDRVLWVDAIRIHQKDDSERGHQVGPMGKIYQRAQSVAVCLGSSDHGSDVAIDFIRQMSKSTAKSRAEDAVSIEILNVLSFLMDRQRFRRRWVAQEIAFAADACTTWPSCGTLARFYPCS